MQNATSMKIKDPSAKGNVLYNVPFHLIEPTYGFKDHYNALFVDTDRKPSHRACLCKLFQEGRCGQGENCKSFHVCRDYVAKSRSERNVQLEEQFINEVVVTTSKDVLFAVRFPAVVRTRGLETYKRSVKRFSDKIFPMPLCESYNPGLGVTGECSQDRNCNKIHIKHAELKDLNENRLRTPCCQNHGARNLPSLGANFVAFLDINGSKWKITADKLAFTDGLQVATGHTYDADSICLLHIKSRCKYGRSCDKLHVCRAFAEKTKVLGELEKVSTQTQNISPATTPRGFVPPPAATSATVSRPLTPAIARTRTNRSGSVSSESLSSACSVGYSPPPTPDAGELVAHGRQGNFFTVRPLIRPIGIESDKTAQQPEQMQDNHEDEPPALLESTCSVLTPDSLFTPYTRQNLKEGEQVLSFANWYEDAPPVIRYYN